MLKLLKAMLLALMPVVATADQHPTISTMAASITT